MNTYAVCAAGVDLPMSNAPADYAGHLAVVTKSGDVDELRASHQSLTAERAQRLRADFTTDPQR